MKKETIKIKVLKKKPRAVVLYKHDTPYKHKVESDDLAYTRKKKHKNVSDEE